MKDNIVLQGSIFSSNGFLVCYSITILFVYKVLFIVMFEGFKAMLLCCVVACKDNNKVIGAGTTELLTGLLIGLLIVLLVWIILWIELWISWEMSERLRGLYPVKNADFVIAF